MVWNNKHKCFVQVNSKANTAPLVFVPPTIQLPTSATCTASEYLKLLRENNEQRRYLLVLVSSSAAALGVFEDDALVLHKVITAYTVRAKQGKAQLHYLRLGGPGRMSVGGGLRARETERLFSRICEKFESGTRRLKVVSTYFTAATCGFGMRFMHATIRGYLWQEMTFGGSRCPTVLGNRVRESFIECIMD